MASEIIDIIEVRGKMDSEHSGPHEWPSHSSGDYSVGPYTSRRCTWPSARHYSYRLLNGKSSWRFIQYDMSELSEELGELFGSFAMENAEDPGDHLELDGFQFAFLRLFRRVEPI